MSLLKNYTCKDCGGVLNFDEDQEIFCCPFCGTEFNFVDFHRTELLNQADSALKRLRFSTAADKYKTLIQKNPEDFEALRGMILAEGRIVSLEDLDDLEKIRNINMKKAREVLDAAKGSSPETTPYFEKLSEAFDLAEDYFAKTHDVIVFAVDLQSVVIHKDCEIVQFVVGGCHGSFPNETFLHLAVTNHGVHFDVLAAVLRAESHTGRDADALSEGTCRCIDTGNLLAVRVSLQDRMQLTKMFQFFLREEAFFRKHCVEAGCRVSFAQNEPVTARILGILGVDTHLGVVHCYHHLDGRKTSTRVTALGVRDLIDDVDTDLAANLFQFLDVHVCLLY